MFTAAITPATAPQPRLHADVMTIEEIAAAATAAGSHFFSPTMMEGFESEVYAHVFVGSAACTFITSEPLAGVTRYTVREFCPTGRIATPRGLRALTLGDACVLAEAYANVGAN